MDEEKKTEDLEKFSFIREKIKEKPLSRKKVLTAAGVTVLLAVLANVVFIVFDRALEGLIVQYLHRLHPRMAKILRGK